MRFPTELRESRLSAGMDTVTLARLGSTSRPTVSAYEHGSKTPSIETAERLLRATGRTLVALRPASPVPIHGLRLIGLLRANRIGAQAAEQEARQTLADAILEEAFASGVDLSPWEAGRVVDRLGVDRLDTLANLELRELREARRPGETQLCVAVGQQVIDERASENPVGAVSFLLRAIASGFDPTLARAIASRSLVADGYPAVWASGTQEEHRRAVYLLRAQGNGSAMAELLARNLDWRFAA